MEVFLEGGDGVGGFGAWGGVGDVVVRFDDVVVVVVGACGVVVGVGECVSVGFVGGDGGGLGVVGGVEGVVSLGGLVVVGMDAGDAGWVGRGCGLAVGVVGSDRAC